MKLAPLAAAAVVVAGSAEVLRAERPVRVRGAAGAYGAVTGPSAWGWMADVVLHPASRYGVSLSWRGDGDHISQGDVRAGLVYEGGASRPRLQVALRAEAGITTDELHPVLGGAVAIELGIVDRAQVSVQLGGSIAIAGSDSSLAISGALLVGTGNLLAP